MRTVFTHAICWRATAANCHHIMLGRRLGYFECEEGAPGDASGLDTDSHRAKARYVCLVSIALPFRRGEGLISRGNIDSREVSSKSMLPRE